jgi:hypothetical protein
MKHQALSNNRSPFITWLYVGIPVLFLITAPMHFIYEWTGEPLVIGLFAPVNESPWEHLKLTFLPMLLWWVVGYLAFGKKSGYPLTHAIVSCAVAEIVSLLFVLSFFYTYTGALGVESLAVDIASVLVGLCIAVVLAVHIVRHAAPRGFWAFISVLVLLGLLFVFVFFTVFPPHLPAFLDRNTGTYGLM